MRSRFGIVGALAMTMAIVAAPAHGSTTIGSNLADPFFNTLNCGAFPTGCSAANGLLLPAAKRAPGGLDAPIDGIVVRWRMTSGASPQPASLRILRPGNSTTRSAVGTSETRTPTASTTTTFDTRLPIKAGDTIGVKSQFPPYAFLSGADVRYWSGPLDDGGPAAASSSLANSELLVNADVEADADHDEYGDETQDLCPLDGTAHEGCLLTVEVEEGGRVTGPGIDCPGDCTEAYPAGTTVHLVSDADKAFAAAGYETTGGTCSGGPFETCDVTMFRNTTVNAIFHDHRSPQTTITKGPKSTTSKRKVKIKFRSDEQPQKFQCALDKTKFVGFCTSPYKKKLKPGKHVFRVRAVDAVSRIDSSPAKVKFEILP